MIIQRCLLAALTAVGITSQAEATVMEFVAKGKFVLSEMNQQYYYTWPVPEPMSLRIVFDTDAATLMQSAHGALLADRTDDMAPFIISAVLSSQHINLGISSPSNYYDANYSDRIFIGSAPDGLVFSAGIGSWSNGTWLGLTYSKHSGGSLTFTDDDNMHFAWIGGARLRELRDPNVVPVPAGVALLPAGVGALFLARRKREKRHQVAKITAA